LAVGTICASVTGFLCIRYFLRYLGRRSLRPFVIYRFILAGAIIIYYFK
jgi:undecaprenyl pyrophosphate phosphatase UppP